MPIIKSPNEQYDGVSASVQFICGEGETSDPWLLNWFKEHGYSVGESEEFDEEKGVVHDVVQPGDQCLEKPKVTTRNKRRKSRSPLDTDSNTNRD